MAGFGAIALSASQYLVKKTIFSSNATPQKMIAANPNRVALIFTDLSGNLFIGTVDKQPTTASGLICLSSSTPVFTMTFDHLGPFVQDEFWSCRVSGASSTGITEVIYQPTGS